MSTIELLERQIEMLGLSSGDRVSIRLQHRRVLNLTREEELVIGDFGSYRYAADLDGSDEFLREELESDFDLAFWLPSERSKPAIKHLYWLKSQPWGYNDAGTLVTEPDRWLKNSESKIVTKLNNNSGVGDV